MAAEGQSDKKAPDMEVQMNQRCGTEFLHEEKIALTFTDAFQTFMETKEWMLAKWGGSVSSVAEISWNRLNFLRRWAEWGQLVPLICVLKDHVLRTLSKCNWLVCNKLLCYWPWRLENFREMMMTLHTEQQSHSPKNNRLKYYVSTELLKSTLLETTLVRLHWVRVMICVSGQVERNLWCKITSFNKVWSILEENHFLIQKKPYINLDKVSLCCHISPEKWNHVSNLGAVSHRCKMETWLWNSNQAMSAIAIFMKIKWAGKTLWKKWSTLKLFKMSHSYSEFHQRKLKASKCLLQIPKESGKQFQRNYL